MLAILQSLGTFTIDCGHCDIAGHGYPPCSARILRMRPSYMPIMRDATGQALAYLLCALDRKRGHRGKQLTVDEARRIPVNIARLPELLKGQE
jgi:hypothetical protein